MANCIILNKAFTGSWLNEDSNIAHEIINFFKADDGNIYAYCAPHGQVPEGQGLDIKCLFLTTQTHDNKCNLLYCFKIKHTLHNQSKFSGGILSDKNNKKRTKAKQEINKKLVELKGNKKQNPEKWEDITYGGVSIKDLFVDNFEVYPVTFIIESVYKAKKGIVFDSNIQTENGDFYNYQRNFGFVVEGDSKRGMSYDKLKELAPFDVETGIIKENLDDWKEISLSKFKRLDINKKEENAKIIAVRKNMFMDLIDNYKAEECYTKIIHKIFKVDNGLILNFVKKCVLPKIENKNDYQINNQKFIPLTEVVVPHGRIDNFAYSNEYALIVENKIDAEFTMKTNGDNQISQLKRYYDWANKEDSNFEVDNSVKHTISDKKKIYVILGPDYRYDELLVKEEQLRNKESFDQYYIVKYSELYSLIKNWSPKNFIFNKYLDDIKLLIYRLSLTRDELYKAKLSEQLYSRNI